MSRFQTIEFELNEQIATIWLNRPDVLNAFNSQMLTEIITCFREIEELDDIRIVIIRGRGKAFCSGADLNWMRDVAKYSFDENYKESLIVSECFETIYKCSKPTIAIIHGAAIGGANGFITPCDFAIAEENTKFSLSEVKIGIVPACISPYLYKRMGEYVTRDLMTSGKRFVGIEAENYRLVNWSKPGNEMEDFVNALIKQLMTSGPEAMHSCKDFLNEISNEKSFDDSIDYTAKKIAELRASEEGQEGMASFLEKRKPNWVN